MEMILLRCLQLVSTSKSAISFLFTSFCFPSEWQLASAAPNINVCSTFRQFVKCSAADKFTRAPKKLSHFHQQMKNFSTEKYWKSFSLILGARMCRLVMAQNTDASEFFFHHNKEEKKLYFPSCCFSAHNSYLLYAVSI